MAQLPHIPEPLKGRRIDDAQSLGLEADVVPERVAYDFKRHDTNLAACGSAAKREGRHCELPDSRRQRTARSSF